MTGRSPSSRSLENKKDPEGRTAPTYDTPFTRETEPWGGRTFVSVQPRHPHLPIATFGDSKTSTIRRPPLSLSVVSYNVLADSNILRVRNCAQAVTNWGRRREILLKEIFSVRADVLCLQDVDYFHEWWGPQLTSAGYDSLFKKRTTRAAAHREGVVIAWKRDMFDLFQSGEMELNRLAEHEEDRALAGRAGTSDNVALMALLQPWEDSDHPSGACVVCTQLYEEHGYYGDAVRSLQAQGLSRTIEAFNSDFTLPIVMCGTMNCVPSSGAYEILCRGVEPRDPARPSTPGKPLVEPISTSAARVRWAAPQDDSESLSPPIDTYRLLWVPGGSRFLPGESVDVVEASCVVYDLVETKSGNVRSEQNPLRSFVVGGLSSGIAYEFRVSAINGLGEGPWSERSDPVRMPYMTGNDPEDRILLGAASIKLLRNRELKEARRRAEERLADPRAYELRKLLKVDGLFDSGEEKLHPFASVSGMTPRYSDATLHPDLANVRTDTGFPIIKNVEEKRLSSGDQNSGGRSRRRGRRVKGVSNNSHRPRSGHEQDTCASSKRGPLIHGYGSQEDGCSLVSSRIIEREDGMMARCEGDRQGGLDSGATVGSSNSGHAVSPEHALPALVDSSGREKDVLLRLEALDVSGARSDRQKHALGLRSAYMSYNSGGEPTFTTLSDIMAGTVDYIFISSDCLLPQNVLSLPDMGNLMGRDIQETEVIPTPGAWAPPEWRGKCGEDGYMGEWSPYLRENPRKHKNRIPNEIFPSDHFMLMASFMYFEPRCPSTWKR